MKEIIMAAITGVAAVVLWRRRKISGKGLLLIFLILASGFMYCLLYGFSGQFKEVSSLIRGEEGSGNRKIELQVLIDREKDKTVQLEVPEKQMSREAAEAELSEFCQRLDQEILGQNTSLLEVCYPLILKSSYGDSPITLQWQTDAPDLVSWEGELGTAIPAEGKEVILKAQLSLQGYRENYERKIFVFPSQAEKDLAGRIKAEADRMNQEAESDQYYLPKSMDRMSLKWYEVSDGKGGALIFVGLLLLAGLVIAGQQKQREDQLHRAEQLDLEYPELVSRMQMLLGAGLSMRKVLERIATEYRETRTEEKKKKNLACEEILICCRELENGLSEMEVYERLGSRCGTPYYRGLALLLEQNMTKGGQGLIPLLEQEALQAFENRQRMARQYGEKVSVRLLLPMGMMLLIVLALIMIPAFMSL